jgi:hypothetical protein
MDAWCVCAFLCVYVVLCLGRSLATNWSPVQGVLPSVNDQETEKSALCSKVGTSSQMGARGRSSELSNCCKQYCTCICSDWNKPQKK